MVIRARRAVRQAFAALALADRPIAMFATTDELVIDLYEVLAEAGIVIPDQVSVVGFDDVGHPHLPALVVTTVRQPVHELGQNTLRLLLAMDRIQPEKLSSKGLMVVSLIARNFVATPIMTLLDRGQVWHHARPQLAVVCGCFCRGR